MLTPKAPENPIKKGVIIYFLTAWKNCSAGVRSTTSLSSLNFIVDSILSLSHSSFYLDERGGGREGEKENRREIERVKRE